MPNATKRLPAEWEPQDAVLLAWPHDRTDWAPVLAEAQRTFDDIAAAIERFQRVLRIGRGGFDIPVDDTWARDFGPMTIEEDGRPVLLDFTFNGWGGKYPADDDNAVTRRLHARGALGRTPLRTVDLVLEGGSIESDGEGTLLVTSQCLLNPNRNPHLTRAQLEDRLGEELGADRILWLEHGSLQGDDTDAHIDTLARLCPDRTILYVACDDPSDEHFEELQAMERELMALPGHRFLPLPWPAAKYDHEGRRLPATYANFLVINGAVLVPTYRDDADERALAVVEKAFPGRRVIGIDCSTLILQNGSLHCVTMQIPRGVL